MMTDILILAERNIGKLIRKYLDREPLHVVHAEELSEVAQMTFTAAPAIVVVDQSHLGESLAGAMEALHGRFADARFIVLCSMEQTEFCESLVRSLAGVDVTRLHKPIKLSELSALLRGSDSEQ
jgi:DNA-binding NtrC family response regulator